MISLEKKIATGRADKFAKPGAYALNCLVIIDVAALAAAV